MKTLNDDIDEEYESWEPQFSKSSGLEGFLSGFIILFVILIGGFVICQYFNIF